jgi:hypothetical protein
MFLLVLCIIDSICTTIFFSAEVNNFANTNIQHLFEKVRKNGQKGQFDGQAFFKKIKSAIGKTEEFIDGHSLWIIWIPFCIRIIIYKILEVFENILKMFGLKTAAGVTHFILQLFRIQCAYDFKTIKSRKEKIIRILQIALNLGQLEGQLGFIFPVNIGSFVVSKNGIKITKTNAIQIEKELNS